MKPERYVEQATAAPGELRVLTDWEFYATPRCSAWRVVTDGKRPAMRQRCTLEAGHDGAHAA